VLERAALVVLVALAATPAVAQQKRAAADCEPGFEQRGYPHGSELNFRCRTRVIDCPEKQGHWWAVIPDQVSETARGVQFGYRCQYTSKER
jgi:hypothetical protein